MRSNVVREQLGIRVDLKTHLYMFTALWGMEQKFLEFCMMKYIFQWRITIIVKTDWWCCDYATVGLHYLLLLCIPNSSNINSLVLTEHHHEGWEKLHTILMVGRQPNKCLSILFTKTWRKSGKSPSSFKWICDFINQLR